MLGSTSASRLRVFLKRFRDEGNLSRGDPNWHQLGRIVEHSIFKRQHPPFGTTCAVRRSRQISSLVHAASTLWSEGRTMSVLFALSAAVVRYAFECGSSRSVLRLLEKLKRFPRVERRW